MNYSFSLPSPVLAPYVKRYWGLSVSGIEECYSQRIVPNGLPELIFYLGHKPEVNHGSISMEDNIVVSGHKNDYYDLQISDDFTLFSIMFHPQGMMAFFDTPVSEFYNRNIPLRYLFKEEIDKLEEKLMQAASFQQRVALVENFLIKRLAKKQVSADINRITYSINAITHTGGIIPVNTLASDTFLSRKQYERIFAASVGISPRQFMRVVRFQHTLAKKAQTPHISLTQLAYESGYYDQSHMINEFRSFSGLTPSEFFAECEPESDLYL